MPRVAKLGHDTANVGRVGADYIVALCQHPDVANDVDGVGRSRLPAPTNFNTPRYVGFRVPVRFAPIHPVKADVGEIALERFDDVGCVGGDKHVARHRQPARFGALGVRAHSVDVALHVDKRRFAPLGAAPHVHANVRPRQTECSARFANRSERRGRRPQHKCEQLRAPPQQPVHFVLVGHKLIAAAPHALLHVQQPVRLISLFDRRKPVEFCKSAPRTFRVISRSLVHFALFGTFRVVWYISHRLAHWRRLAHFASFGAFRVVWHISRRLAHFASFGALASVRIVRSKFQACV